MKTQTLILVFFLFLLVVFSIKGLNLAAKAICEVSGQQIGPVMSISFEKDRDVIVTCFAQNWKLPTSKVIEIMSKELESVIPR